MNRLELGLLLLLMQSEVVEGLDLLGGGSEAIGVTILIEARRPTSPHADLMVVSTEQPESMTKLVDAFALSVQRCAEGAQVPGKAVH